MTLSFILSSIRRHGRVVVLAALLGAVAGIAVSVVRVSVYQADATLLIEPPDAVGGVTIDADKYAAAQLSLLSGTGLVTKVAAAVPGSSVKSIRDAVTIEFVPPNAVKLSAIEIEPVRAQHIANTYATEYLTDQKDRLTAGAKAELVSIDAQLAQVTAESDVLTQAIANAGTDAGKIVPLSTKLSGLDARASRLIDQKNEFQFVVDQELNSELIQPAELPKQPVGLTRVEWGLVGLFLGILGGTALAAAWAANSGRLLDVRQLEELLGAPVAARLPATGTLSRDPASGLEILPAKVASRIDRLCVRAEGVGPAHGRQLRVAVVGTAAECGVTTLSLMLGARMAQSRMTVGLVDADALNPWISRRLSRNVVSPLASTDGRSSWGVGDHSSRVVARGSATSSGRSSTPATDVGDAAQGSPGSRRSARANRSPAVTSAALAVATPDPAVEGVELSTLPTSVDRLVVVGQGPRAEQALQRANLEDVLVGLESVDVDVVVFDAGSMMDSALSVRLCQQVDAVVLLVPLARQSVDQIRVVRRLFEGRDVEILPVVTDLVARRELD